MYIQLSDVRFLWQFFTTFIANLASLQHVALHYLNEI